MRADGSGQHQVANGANPEWSTVPRGATKPLLRFSFQKLNRKSKCLGRLDGYFVVVKTNASRKTRFDITFILDGKVIEKEYESRGFGSGVDALRKGRHHIRVLVEDAAVRDRIARTFAFRRC
jgi:hypothetical protein